MLNTMKNKFAGFDRKWKNIKWKMKKTSINFLLPRIQGSKLKLYRRFATSNLNRL